MPKSPSFLSLLLAMVVAGCSSQPQRPAVSMVIPARRTSWQTAYGNGERVITAHYVIYSTAHTPALRRYLPGFMEAAYHSYLELSGLADKPLAGGRMSIYMLSSRQEWVALTKKVTGPLAESCLGIEAGGYCYKGGGVFWDMGGLATLSIAAHEGLHQFFYQRMRHRLPLWLEEGLCTTMEGYEIAGESVRFTWDRNAARFTNLRQALINGWWIPLKQLLPMDAGDVTHRRTKQAVGYYGQLWALVAFLRSRQDYRNGMRRLIADAEAGNLQQALDLSAGEIEALLARGRYYNRAVSEKLFRYYISDDLDRFDREFRAFAERLAGL